MGLFHTSRHVTLQVPYISQCHVPTMIRSSDSIVNQLICSVMIKEMLRDRSLVGTAVATQVGTGFLVTVVSFFLVSGLEPYLTWSWIFALLAPGPVCAIACMI